MSAPKLTDKQVSRLAYIYRARRARSKEFRRPYLIHDIAKHHRSLGRLEAAIEEQDSAARQRRHPARELSIAERLHDSVERRHTARLRKMWPLGRAFSSWAGGETSFSVTISPKQSEPGCAADTSRVWSGNGKWSGNNLDVHLSIAPSMRFTVVSGVLTIYRRGVDLRNGCACWWVRQSRGYSVRVESGYLVRGNHVRAKTLQAAQKRVAKQRQAAAVAAWKRRFVDRHRAEILQRVWVSREDSLRAGNCSVGTDGFCRRLFAAVGGEIGGMRADALIDAAKTIGQSVFVERAVNAAIARYGY